MKICIPSASPSIAIGAIFAFAQSTADTVQRGAKPQTPIEHGLQDAKLSSTGRAGIEHAKSKPNARVKPSKISPPRVLPRQTSCAN